LYRANESLIRFSLSAHYGSVMRSFWVLSLPLTDLVIASLAVWRLTHLLWGEDGPGKIFVALRRLAGRSFFGQVLDCFYCLSLWISLPVACWIGSTWMDRAFAWFSMSGAAILLERFTNPPSPAAAPAVFYEEPEGR